MNNYKIIYTFLFTLAAISYAATYAVGQETKPQQSAMMEHDDHDGHDNHEDHDHGAEDAHGDHEGHDHTDGEMHDDHDGHEEHEGHGDHDHGTEDAHGDHEGHDHADGEMHDDHDEDADHEGHDHGHEESDGKIKLSSDTLIEFGIDVKVAGSAKLNLETVLPGEVQVNEDRQAHIVPRFSGLTIDVRKSIGDQVKKGEVLAVLEGNESLVPYELKSLIDGTIIEKHITLGESLSDDTPVFTVADLSTVWIDLTVYQKDISIIQRGQTVLISGGEHIGTSEGTVSYISPTVDEHTRTSLARVVLPNADGNWRPGMFVVGTISLTTQEASVAVPRDAIVVVEGEPSVFVLTPDGFMPRAVKTGGQDAEHIEILEGLEAGERYAASNVLPLKAELNRAGLEHAGHAH